MFMHRPLVIVGDTIEPDSLAATLAACRLYEARLKAVIATGWPARLDRSEPMTHFDQHYAQRMLRLNARRVKGMLRRASYGHVPVFEGLIHPHTLVPYNLPVSDDRLDMWDDNYYYEGCGQDYTFDDVAQLLTKISGMFDIVATGPLTEVAALMRLPRLKSKLGTLTCQLGLFGSKLATIHPEGLTPNSAADPEATAFVLSKYPGNMYMVPTNITKRATVGFDTVTELRQKGINPELVQLWEVFMQHLPPGSRIYPHDVHPVFLLAQLRGLFQQLGYPWNVLYEWRELCSVQVGARGEITAKSGVKPHSAKRFAVSSVNAHKFTDLFRRLCA